MYAFAAEELEENGLPAAGQDYFSLNSVFHGLLALPNRADYADMLLAAFTLLNTHPEYGPPISSLDSYLMPGDTWIVDALLEIVTSFVSQPEQRTRAQADITAMKQSMVALAAIGVLGLVGDARAGDVLLTALSYPDARCSTAAARALGELRATAALEPIIALLRQRREPHMIAALGMLRTSEGTDFLRELLNEYRAEQAIYFGDYTRVVRALLEALASSGEQRIIPAMVPFLAVADPAVNLAAAMALSRLGDERGLPIIYEALHNEESRWDAAKCLIERNDPAGLPVLIDWYHHDPYRYPDHTRDPASRLARLHELSRYGDTGDIPFLEWVAGYDQGPTQQGWSVAEEARRAIERIRARHQRATSAYAKPSV